MSHPTIMAVVAGSHIPAAAKYARDHFGGSGVAVVVRSDDVFDLYGIDPDLPVILMDGNVIFKFPHAIRYLIDRGHTLVSHNRTVAVTHG